MCIIRWIILIFTRSIVWHTLRLPFSQIKRDTYILEIWSINNHKILQRYTILLSMLKLVAEAIPPAKLIYKPLHNPFSQIAISRLRKSEAALLWNVAGIVFFRSHNIICNLGKSNNDKMYHYEDYIQSVSGKIIILRFVIVCSIKKLYNRSLNMACIAQCVHII